MKAHNDNPADGMDIFAGAIVAFGCVVLLLAGVVAQIGSLIYP